MSPPAMPPRTTPDFLAIGHLTLDVTPGPGDAHGRVRPGGAAAYAARTARGLGLRVAVVTSISPSYPVGDVLPGIETYIVESPFTTFFQNVYGPAGRRTQVLGGRASPITRDRIPEEWLSAPIVFLGPLVRELPPDAPAWFPGARVGAAVQGWLRTWDDYGRVSVSAGRHAGPPDGLTPGMDLAAGSADELLPGTFPAWAAHARTVGVTEGAGGCRVLFDGEVQHVPAFRADEQDPTGAGDVWAAAFLVRVAESGDPLDAARFANAAGSVSIEREGLLGAPSMAEVLARLARG